MATIFLDTSAVVRRYDPSEPGSAMVRAICAPSRRHALLVSPLVPVEVASAFGRKARVGALGPHDVARLWRLFQNHWQRQYRVVLLSSAALARAEELALSQPLRAYDAVHLGCALVTAPLLTLAPLEFWTADRQQARAATAEGLGVRLVG